jgi:hypothetical protein
MRSISGKNFRGNQNIHFVSKVVLPKILSFARQLQKYGIASQTIDDMA